jgi:RNA polymerase sigma factor, sigma-70 family
LNSDDLKGETELLKLISQGDEKAFAGLFNHYRPIIFTTVLRLTDSISISEEIVQDVFLKAWLKRNELPSIRNMGGWLYTIASNLTYNALQKNAREKSKLILMNKYPDSANFYTNEDLLVNKEFETILKQAVDKLPAKQRQSYRLIKEDGLKRNEAAAQMNVSPETVKANLDAAMKKIRAYILSRILQWHLIWLCFQFN